MGGKGIIILCAVGLVVGGSVAFYQGIKSAYDNGYKDGTNKVLDAWQRQDRNSDESWKRFEEVLKQHKNES